MLYCSLPAPSASGETVDPLANLLPWIAAGGTLSLIAATFLERVFPFLPSYLLLVVVGVAVSEGYFSLPIALALCTLGSVLGCLPVYAIGATLGEARSRNILGRSARFVGLSSAKLEHLLERFRANERLIVFGAQMVPTVRLLAPGVSGVLRAEFLPFLVATTFGAALWNAIFIGAGYGAASAFGDINTAFVAIKAMLALIVAEGLLLAVWRVGKNCYQGSRKEHNACASDDSSRAADLWAFLRAWVAAPLRVAAVAPSSTALAELMTGEIDATAAPVIELGAGTGVFTHALIRRGVPEDKLILVESDRRLAELLTRRFPSACTLPVDAVHFSQKEMDIAAPAGAAISGLPLLSMPRQQVVAILGTTFDRMRPQGALYQFTYGLRCPISKKLLDELGLEATRIGGTLANIPPASVYRINRRTVRIG